MATPNEVLRHIVSRMGNLFRDESEYLGTLSDIDDAFPVTNPNVVEAGVKGADGETVTFPPSPKDDAAESNG